MLMYFIPTVLIPAQKWARRPGNGRGSVACTEKGRRGKITYCEPSVRVSHVRLKCILEGETQRGVKMCPMLHGDSGDISSCVWEFSVRPNNQPRRRTSSEEANGVESQPNHDAASYSTNAGSPNLVRNINSNQHGDGVPIVPNGWPVMGPAVGNQSDRGGENKLAVMSAKPLSLGGSGTVSVICLATERRITSVI